MMRRNGKIGAALLIVLFLAGCYVLRYSTPEKASSHTVPGKYKDIESYLDLYKDVSLDGLYFRSDSPIKYIPATKDLEQDWEDFQPDLEFIHISDVQLRDERANLFSRGTSGFMDKFVSSVRFDPIQEKYDTAVFQCLLLGVEAYLKKSEKGRAAFLMHTGDSVHVSLMSEAWEFLYLLDSTLETIPWFNIIGNHDVTVFGTPTLGRSARMKDPTMGFFPLPYAGGGDYSDPAKYIGLHGKQSFNMSGIPFTGPVRIPNDLQRQSGYRFTPEETALHGFDMHVSDTEAEDRLKGYYSFDVEIPVKEGREAPQKVRFIALNTAEYVGPNAYGGVSSRQIKWLEKLLSEETETAIPVVAFGHHPLIPKEDSMRTDGVYAARLRKVQSLFKKHGVVYFAGHNHDQSYNREFGFLQVVVPSLLEYPQSGHIVRMDFDEDRLRIEIEPISHAEMFHRENLRRGFSAMVSLFEPSGMVKSVIGEIEKTWKTNLRLKDKEIADIIPLLEGDRAVKEIIDPLVPFGLEKEVRNTLAKASLLRQAYLAREASLKDKKEKRYYWLGDRYRFTLPAGKKSPSNQN